MPTIGVLLDGDVLKRLRSAQRLSSTEVARALELHPTFYSRVEAGTARVSLKTLRVIENFYGLDPAKLDLVHPAERSSFVAPA